LAAGLDVAPEEAPPTEPLPADLQRKAEAPQATPAAQPQQQPTQQRPVQTQRPASVQTISGPQASRFWAIGMKTWGDHKKIMDYLRNVLGVQRKEEIPVAQYDEAIAWAEGKQGDA
jgi:hypothetical protein